MKHTLNIKTAGVTLENAKKVLIMLHGRGGSAENILSLAQYFNVKDYALLAPEATNQTWYPYSFITPVEQNEPWLTSAISIVEQTLQKATESGIKPENVYFFGFSQGACLTLEFLARTAQKYGGAVVIIGGLIGKEINRRNYKGNFDETPIFIGTSNPDFHVPVERVHESVAILKEMNAFVTEKVYDNSGHAIIEDEIDWANKLIFT